MAMSKQLDLFLDTMLVSTQAPDQNRATDVRTQDAPDDMLYADQQASLTQQLQHELQSRCNLGIALTITDNTSSMMSLRYIPNENLVRVRLHRMFLSAPEELRKALAYWVKHPRSQKYGRLFREFIVDRNHEIRNAQGRALKIVTKGNIYDLKAIFDELNQEYFNESITVAITWGRDCSRNIRSIRFGGFFPDEQLIRIHPRLDRAFVPSYIIRYIVYHEMLHAHLGIEQTTSGRRNIHPKAFKQKERAFPDYEKAIAWIENSTNLHRILRRSRKL